MSKKIFSGVQPTGNLTSWKLPWEQLKNFVELTSGRSR